MPRAFFALAFENELEYHYLYVCVNSSNDQVTSRIDLVGLLTSTSRVQLCRTSINQRSGKYIDHVKSQHDYVLLVSARGRHCSAERSMR